jgi:hypothetical protein
MRVVGRQPYVPAAFTPGEIPGTHFQGLSRPQGTWLHQGEPRKKSPVTPPDIDPGTSRLAAQCLNHYTTPGPLYLSNCSEFFVTITNTVISLNIYLFPSESLCISRETFRSIISHFQTSRIHQPSRRTVYLSIFFLMLLRNALVVVI